MPLWLQAAAVDGDNDGWDDADAGTDADAAISAVAIGDDGGSDADAVTASLLVPSISHFPLVALNMSP